METALMVVCSGSSDPRLGMVLLQRESRTDEALVNTSALEQCSLHKCTTARDVSLCVELC